MENGASVEFPRGTYYAVTWGIESDHGGMTSALLHRSRAFVRLAGVSVTAITYEHQENFDAIRQELRQRGLLTDQISIINLWEDLRTWDDEKLRTALEVVDGTDTQYFDPLLGRGNESSSLREIQRREDKVIEQTDYYRADGTLLLSYRRFIEGHSGTRVTLCDTSGKPIGYWRGVRRMYRFWLASLPKDPVAFMILDSKTAANHYPEFRRSDTVTIYMVHGSHIANGKEPPYGELSVGRAHTFGHLADFDSVVFLTHRQRDDVQLSHGPLDNLYVCPNSRDTSTQLHAEVKRIKNQGIAIGALVGGKRFNHAINGIMKAKGYGVRAKLTIFGRGPKEKALLKKIVDKELERQVKLGGYTTQADVEFAKSSFVLLTSNREGLGLVLIEAMTQGCVPIAYDIAYGPAEIITDGVDGFLVEPGDTDALGQTIARFCKLSKREKKAMRTAAVRRAQDFNDAAIVERWARIFSDSLRRKDQYPSHTQATDRLTPRV